VESAGVDSIRADAESRAVGSLNGVQVDTAIQLWQDGQRRLRDADADVRPLLERVTDEIVDELRRRLGGAFTSEELTRLYEGGADWALDVAMATAPHEPRAWDADTVANAAFARYVREATDYAGGRRRLPEELEEPDDADRARSVFDDLI
jgi:hypothetical protein